MVLTHQIPLVSGTYIYIYTTCTYYIDVFAEIRCTMLYLDSDIQNIPVPASILSNAFCVFCGLWLLLGRWPDLEWRGGRSTVKFHCHLGKLFCLKMPWSCLFDKVGFSRTASVSRFTKAVDFVSLRQIALGAVVGFFAFDMFSLMHLSSFFNPERTLPNFYEDALRQTVGPKWQLLPPRMLAVFHIGLDWDSPTKTWELSWWWLFMGWKWILSKSI